MQGPELAFDEWLGLREPADAAARDLDLAARVGSLLPSDRRVVVHDLGCGSGSMSRWLAVLLPGPQHWVLHDRDADLLARARQAPPTLSCDAAPVTVETRQGDITRLPPDVLTDGALVTASALLDMLTAAELERLVAACVGARCPTLITLSVTGQVELAPSDPIDERIRSAFNAHQRRTTDAGELLGPDAVGAAREAFTARDFDVEVRPSPWRLGADQSELMAEWFRGWVAAATEQQPELAAEVASYADRRLAEASAGRLSVTVHHQDLLALPRG